MQHLQEDISLGCHSLKIVASRHSNHCGDGESLLEGECVFCPACSAVDMLFVVCRLQELERERKIPPTKASSTCRKLSTESCCGRCVHASVSHGRCLQFPASPTTACGLASVRTTVTPRNLFYVTQGLLLQGCKLLPLMFITFFTTTIHVVIKLSPLIFITFFTATIHVVISCFGRGRKHRLNSMVFPSLMMGRPETRNRWHTCEEPCGACCTLTTQAVSRSQLRGLPK